MANDIKQKIVLEGEKEYNRALSDAKRNLKTLRSELKAETAELGANATAQQKNETRIKSLQKQIKEQEKIVKTYQEALKEVKEKYGDNEEAVAKWEVKLNEARTSLANMKNELEGVGEGFKGIQGNADMATVATKSVADAFGKLSEVGGAISDSIEGVFTTLLSNVKQMITAAWAEVVNVAAKANNWTDTAAFLGSTASEVQMWDRAVTAAQGDFSKLTSAINKLKYGGKEKEIAELFGISDVNYQNDLQYTVDLISLMVQKKEEMQSSGSWDGAMATLFGKKMPQEVEWFINNWDTIQRNLQTFNAEEGGFGLTGDELQTMNDLYVKIGEVQEKWNAFKESVTTKLFGGLAFDITTNASNILDALNEYFNAEDDAGREAALKKIEENILAMFTAAKNAIEKGIAMLGEIAEDLKASDNPTAQALGNILSGLVDALKWLTEDNMNNVVKALGLLADFWLIGKGFQMGTAILDIVKNIKTIQGFNATGGASNAAQAIAKSTGGTGVADLGTLISTAITGSGLAGKIAAAMASMTMSVGVVTMAVPLISMLGDIITNKENSKWVKLWKGTEEEKVAENMTPEMKRKALNTPLKDLLNGTVNTKEDLPQANLGRSEGPAIYKDRSPNKTEPDVTLQDIQKATAEAYWDVMKTGMFGADYEDAYNAMEQAFWSNQDALDKLLTLMDEIYNETIENGNNPKDIEDLPADWWSQVQRNGGNAGNQDGLTSADAKSMTDAVNQMPKAVARGVSGLRVIMDGQTVGSIVAPYVSAAIATAIV